MAGVATPVTLALTEKGPTAPFAVKADEVAAPDESVVVVKVMAPRANVPLAPLAGAVNVTDTPPTGLPPESLTVATSGAANGVLIGALWPSPPVAVIDAGGPTTLVTVKLAPKLATNADTL